MTDANVDVETHKMGQHNLLSYYHLLLLIRLSENKGTLHDMSDLIQDVARRAAVNDTSFLPRGRSRALESALATRSNFEKEETSDQQALRRLIKARQTH